MGSVRKLSIDALDIVCFPKDRWTALDKEAWDELADRSLSNNPFFERWCLGPAFDALSVANPVYLVGVFRDQKLIVLFPIERIGKIPGLRRLAVWNHPEFFKTDPLYSEILDFKKIFVRLAQRFNAVWIELSKHQSQIFDLEKQQFHIYQKNSSRPVIKADGISDLSNVGKGKVRRENKRIVNKLEKSFNTRFVKVDDIEEGFTRYLQIENSGWKGRACSSIVRRKDALNYYLKIMRRSQNHIEIYELWADEKCIASCIRYRNKDFLYDVKTTYDEAFSQYYPGRVLEIKCLEWLSSQEFTLLDSCTSPKNQLINRLWPHRAELFVTYIFSGLLTGLAIKLAIAANHTIRRTRRLPAFHYLSKSS